MPQRLRKLIGAIAMVGFLTVYCLTAMVVGATHFATAGSLAQLLYYVVAGLAWVLPAMLIIWWMQRPDPDRAP
ncbi:DUF2842 domain-containing protein [Kaustia mangrovi]|uniref:DUF2842 domain-containing protein n=2 Tax=Kaustia mangrovi TaxID=2593653 RepID=A0A7S8HE84_9HYPH|nr:DUF2842 domain-containing protein [Kaustia mangrovi]QPC45451.1 DUF2842 domain-containing protein [Kaustia mangrovi]